MNDTTPGGYLRHLREAAGWTQQELAEAIRAHIGTREPVPA